MLARLIYLMSSFFVSSLNILLVIKKGDLMPPPMYVNKLSLSSLFFNLISKSGAVKLLTNKNFSYSVLENFF